MTEPDAWPAAAPIGTARLVLEPLRVGHAEELAPLLDDVGLHWFIGGRPASLPELRDRYRRQSAGRSPDGGEGWLNWLVRGRNSGAAVGTVQATLTDHDGGSAELAWMIGTPYQGRGYAGEAASAMVDWLRGQGVRRFTAHVHPGHAASMRVAARIGLSATEIVVDGEVRWAGSDRDR